MNKYFIIDPITTVFNEVTVTATGEYNGCSLYDIVLTFSTNNSSLFENTNKNIHYNQTQNKIYYNLYNSNNKVTKYDTFYFTIHGNTYQMNDKFKNAIAPYLKYGEYIDTNIIKLPYTINAIGQLGYSIRKIPATYGTIITT